MEKTKSIYKKIFEVQKEIAPIKKDLDNPFFKSKYFDINSLLEELKPLLQTRNLLLLQPLTISSDIVTLTTIIVDCDSGEKLEYPVKLMEQQDPQKYGSMITYFRRYALTSLFALQGEDDDGNEASTVSNPTKTKAKIGQDELFPTSRIIEIVNLTEQSGTSKTSGKPFTRYIVELKDGRKPSFFELFLKVKVMKLPKNTPINLDDPKVGIDIEQNGNYWNVVDKVPTVQEDIPTEDSEVLCNTCGFEIFKECKYNGHHPKS